MKTYTPKKWDLSGLQGISDATLEMHFGLYEGYVKNTNTLIELTTEARQKGEAAGSNPKFAELVRRMGWEFNGMRLHEYYFDNLTKNAGELKSGRLHDLLGSSYGDFESWKKDFFAVGGMRGVGWAQRLRTRWHPLDRASTPHPRSLRTAWRSLRPLCHCPPFVSRPDQIRLTKRLEGCR